MIISRTPFRISFFGGGTDYPEWYREHGGGVLSTSIAHYCYLNCRHLPQFFDYKNRIVWSKIETVNAVNDIVHPAVREILKKYDLNGLEIHHDGALHLGVALKQCVERGLSKNTAKNQQGGIYVGWPLGHRKT